MLEPPGLLRGDGKRPDGMTLVPWFGGTSMVWDFACPEGRKCSKYEDISHIHFFNPVAVETMGAWGPEATDLIEALGWRLFEATQGQRSTFFLRQRVDIAIQRGNALSVSGTFPSKFTELDLSL